MINLLGASLIEKVEKSEEKIKQLKARIDELEWALDDQEQYSRRTCLRIKNDWVEQEDEDTDELLLHLFNEELGVDVDEADIGRSHRVGRPVRGAAEQRRPIIVRFLSYRVRAKVFKARFKLKSRNIFVNEDLTRKRDTLAYKAEF